MFKVLRERENPWLHRLVNKSGKERGRERHAPHGGPARRRVVPFVGLGRGLATPRLAVPGRVSRFTNHTTRVCFPLLRATGGRWGIKEIKPAHATVRKVVIVSVRILHPFS